MRHAIDGCGRYPFQRPRYAGEWAAFDRPSGKRGDGAFPQVRKLSWWKWEPTSSLLSPRAPIEPARGHCFPSCCRTCSRACCCCATAAFSATNSGKAWFCGAYICWSGFEGHAPQRLSSFPMARIWRRFIPMHAPEKDRQGIVVRVIKYTLNDPQRVGHQEEHTLLTDLLDASKYPALELIPGYHWRWEHELGYAQQKTYQDPPRASKPTHLRSETPTGVRQEIYALSLAHFVIRSLMFQAARRAGLDTDRLSFTGCHQTLECRCRNAIAALRSRLKPGMRRCWMK